MASEAMENHVPVSKTRIKKRKFYKNQTNTMLKLKKEEINENGKCSSAEANIIKINEIHEKEKRS